MKSDTMKPSINTKKGIQPVIPINLIVKGLKKFGNLLCKNKKDKTKNKLK
ncbi:MAG: hypothetical protein P8J53_06115 [Alphaproteobacteria bacterium]|nr:hypothetical protein [Alphaproteobacteria bacterium]